MKPDVTAANNIIVMITQGVYCILCTFVRTGTFSL